VRRQNGATYFHSVRIDKNAMAINDVDVRSCEKEIGNICERSREKSVVAVQKRHNVAIDAGEASIDRMGLPVVQLASPADVIAAILQELDCAVRRCSVLYVIMEVRIVLTKDAVDRCVQKPGVIKAGRHDGDARNVGGQRR